MRTKPAPGTVVRLTGQHLRSTGQALGSAGMSRWAVIECCCSLCATGNYCAVNEHVEGDDCMRHFHVGNIERAKGGK